MKMEMKNKMYFGINMSLEMDEGVNILVEFQIPQDLFDDNGNIIETIPQILEEKTPKFVEDAAKILNEGILKIVSAMKN